MEGDAQAVEHDYDDLLNGTISAPKDVKTNPTEEEKRLIKMNKKAYGQMIMGLKGVPFGIVKASKSNEHPKGDAKLAWDALLFKYESQEADMEVDLEVMLHNCKMASPTEDPDRWFQQLFHLRRQLEDMGRKKEDYTIIAIILTHLPDDYQTVKTTN